MMRPKSDMLVRQLELSSWYAWSNTWQGLDKQGDSPARVQGWHPGMNAMQDDGGKSTGSAVSHSANRKRDDS